MLNDYHMHFEYGSYTDEFVLPFFEQAKKLGLSEIGITEHTHGFKEFKDLYYEEMILDDSEVGNFQKKWLSQETKFVHTLDEYQDYINLLKKRGFPVKWGIEVCNFKNQKKVQEILSKYEFDYLIVSIHFINGWGFDFSALKHKFNEENLTKIWSNYVKEIENVANTGFYDILGHPFNLRLFKNIPNPNEIENLLESTAKTLKKNNMIVDVNTGTSYRYPIKEITPYADFMKYVKKYDIPIILSSDAHYYYHVGMNLDRAAEYVKKFEIDKFVKFDKRKRSFENI